MVLTLPQQRLHVFWLAVYFSIFHIGLPPHMVLPIYFYELGSSGECQTADCVPNVPHFGPVIEN